MTHYQRSQGYYQGTLCRERETLALHVWDEVLFLRLTGND